jgi:acetoin utilization protein AcuB
MNAGELISPTLSALRRTDTVEAALDLMNSLGVGELAVAEQQQLLGYAPAAKIWAEDPDATLEQVLEFPLYPLQARADQHLYEIVPMFAALQATVLAVCAGDGRYLGMIDLRQLNALIGSTLTYKGVGAILELELAPRDFSPAELMRLVELNGAKVVGMVVNDSNDDQLIVHLKLNTTVLKAILATFERYGYQVVAAHLREDTTQGDDERFRSYLKFLDI